MSDRRKIGEAFGRAASRYDAHAQLQHAVREECLAMAKTCWKQGASVLDIGGGTGLVAEEIRQRGLDWRMTHLDFSFGMCQEAKKHHIQAVNATAEALPFADASFDGALSSLMLQWVSDPLTVFKEIARILRKEGTAIVTTFAEGTLAELGESFKALNDASHVNRFANPASLTALAVHSGFKLLACEEETFTSGHDSVASLMRSLKAIGAATVLGPRRKGLMTPSQLKTLEQTYRAKFAAKPKKGAGDRARELPATWQVLYMMLERT